MRFKIGDKVRVKTDLVTDVPYNDGCICRKEMTALRGKVVTIKSFHPDYTRYHVLEDPAGWCWTDEMFEPVGFCKDLLRDGVIVKRRDDSYAIITGGYSYSKLGHCCLSDYDENLICSCCEKIDIMAIYKPNGMGTIDSLLKGKCLELIAERPEEVKEMTLDEVCKELGYNVKIVKEV